MPDYCTFDNEPDAAFINAELYSPAENPGFEEIPENMFDLQERITAFRWSFLWLIFRLKMAAGRRYWRWRFRRGGGTDELPF